MNANLLDVRNLNVSFHTDDGVFKAVDNVSLHVKRGEIVGLIGESGCGKSVTSLSILKLIPSPPGKIDSGQIFFNGHDLLKLNTAELRKIRGKAISVVFQEPLSALSPLQRIGQQLVEALKIHNDISKKEAWALAAEWLDKVKIPDVKERMFAYPFQLSGGMQQRVMIAMAMMMEPDLIIADEPTTALDVTIQAQILDLLHDLQERHGAAILFISHDFGVVSQMADDIAVMYAGRIIEQGSAAEILESPTHPYTRALLATTPRLDHKADRLPAIVGRVPSPFERDAGCHFRKRCDHAVAQCAASYPELIARVGSHPCACHVVNANV